MAYDFTFDFTKLSRSFFKDLARFAEKKRINERMGSITNFLVKKFNIDQITGIAVSDSVIVVQDLIDNHIRNLSERENFLRTNKRALLLPHCARKYMDYRCKAQFDPKLSSYVCQHCSPDCLVNKATKLAKSKGYDVYVLPGGSGIKKILKNKNYEGIVGTACTEEIKLGSRLLRESKIPHQGVPLLKNGCSGTIFSLETLERTL